MENTKKGWGQIPNYLGKMYNSTYLIFSYCRLDWNELLEKICS